MSHILLRRVAVLSALSGAAGSLVLMLHAGRRQQSRLLVLLFAIWVVSPFIAALIANSVSKRWPEGARTMLYVLMMVLALGSWAIYGAVAFEYVKAKTGFVFLVVPFGSWLLIAVVVAAAMISARKSGA
jgi:ABC-type transport system involved in multi-copper enzyme maturation permease subunit